MRGHRIAGRCAVLLVVGLLSACGGTPVASLTTVGQPPPASTIASTTTVAVLEPTTSTAVAEMTTPQPAITTTDPPPPTTTSTVPAPAIDPNCPTSEHGAVVDRDRQRAYLCDHGVALDEFVITTAIGQPDPGVYPVYARTMHTSSGFGGHHSTMTHFVAFTRGKETGARIAFHTLPVLTSGEYAQPLESVGAPEHRGDSAGCIRVLPEQGPIIWDWLHEGDQVHVVT